MAKRHRFDIFCFTICLLVWTALILDITRQKKNSSTFYITHLVLQVRFEQNPLLTVDNTLARDFIISVEENGSTRLAYELNDNSNDDDYNIHNLTIPGIDAELDNVRDPDRYLIYRCDLTSMTSCGRWTDRLKGIMNGYIIANLTGRIFKAEILTPGCDIQSYIVPNILNWSLPISFHNVVMESQDVRILNYFNNKDIWKGVRNINTTKTKYVYFNSNLDFVDAFRNSIHFQKQLSWMKPLTRNQINAVIFKRLFKVSPQLQSKLDAFLAGILNRQNRLICLHMKADPNPSLPGDTKKLSRKFDLPRIWEFMRRMTKDKPNDRIIISSDSKTITGDAKRQEFGFKVFSPTESFLHVEHDNRISKRENCRDQEKMILEQFLLMQCDVLIINKSYLSHLPAYFRGADEDLYCLQKRGIIVPCRNTKIQEV